ncbi:MAG: PEP-CTERM sorting domain-containing protein [Phycisphaerae bacterium]
MKRVLTKSIFIVVLFAKFTYGIQLQANNDGTGIFSFSYDTSGPYVACGNRVGGIGGDTDTYQQHVGQSNYYSSSNLNINRILNVNANSMTINPQISVSGSGSFGGTIDRYVTSTSTWVPPSPAIPPIPPSGSGFDYNPGQPGVPEVPGYWLQLRTSGMLINPINYSCTYQLTGVITQSPVSISPYPTFGFNSYYVRGMSSLTGTLTLGTETIPFSYNDIGFVSHLPGGTFDNSNYPNSLTMNTNNTGYYDSLQVEPVIYSGSVEGHAFQIIVPEPATLSVLVLGSLSFLRRKRL